MSLCLAKVPSALAERIVADPELLELIWDENEGPDGPDADIAALDEDRDLLLEDYLGLAREVDQQPLGFPWMRRALHGSGVELDYDLGYGNVFTVTPQEAAEIADGLAREGWWTPGLDAEFIQQAIGAFYQAAADEGRTVIGGIM